MALAYTAAFLLLCGVVAHLWWQVRRLEVSVVTSILALEGCVRYLIRQSEAHHADVDALAETLDDVAAGGGDGEWQ